ncbi:hydrocephalus-inducing protein-like [Melanerpes formicivorus]|uniref:hydrocephalus-inducing protein-like n=1 Tax=Melanerpes formicivorus TaxID=211600 RepID=UPI0035902A34
MASALLCLLRAVGNCPHIYFVNLLQDYGSWQARQRGAEELQGLQQQPQQAAARREEAELGEEESEAPPEQQARLQGRSRQHRGRQRAMEQLAGEPGDQHLKEEEELKRFKQGKSEHGKDKGKGSQSLAMQGSSTSSTNQATSSHREVTVRADQEEAVQEHPDSASGSKEEEKQSREEEKKQSKEGEEKQGREGQKQSREGLKQGREEEEKQGREGLKQGREGQKQSREGQKQGREGLKQGREEEEKQGREGQKQSKEEEENQGREGQKQGREGQKQGREGQKQGKVPLADALQPSEPEEEEPKGKAQSESEKSLALRFKAYEASQKEVAHILSCWDRVQGVLLAPAEPGQGQQAAAERRQHSSGRGSRRDREKQQQRLQEQQQQQRLQEEQQQQRLQEQHLEKEKLEKELKALQDSKLSQLAGGGAAGSASSQDVGVPCLAIEVLSSGEVLRTLLESSKLPRAEQVLGELGLGPSGPPIPPTAFYSVVQYPARRELPAALQQFTLVVPGAATVPEEKEDASSVVDAPSVPTAKASKEQGPPARGHSRREKASRSQEAVSRKQSSGHGRRDPQRPATGPPSPCPAGQQSPLGTVPLPGRSARLSSCRWVVPAQGQVVLQVHFSSALLGSFEQRLHFELLGTRRPYQLHCRGTCLYPSISQEPG